MIHFSKFVLVGAGIVAWLTSCTGLAQISTQSYSDDYYQSLAKYHVPLSPTMYLWDRYYRQNPAVTPYLGLTLPRPLGATDYQAYVQPELQQRQQQEQAAYDAKFRQRPQQMQVPPGGLEPVYTNEGALPDRSASFYQNHWYGQWQGRR
jgi:hypothetical protein